MIQSNNGQCLSRRGNYTGERLARERPRVYRQVMRLLSEGISARKICGACHVTRETVRAVERREAESISARKQELAATAARVAQAAIEQIEDDLAVGKIKGVQLVPVFGVAVDKLQALSGDPALTISLNRDHHHLDHRRIHEFVQRRIRQVPIQQVLDSLPDEQTSSPSHADTPRTAG
jgi:transcriptional regulator with XRE-family HTH domain